MTSVDVTHGGSECDSTSWRENVGKDAATTFWRQHCRLVLWQKGQPLPFSSSLGLRPGLVGQML